MTPSGASPAHRSAIAASLLHRDGYRDVADLVGGLAAWESTAHAAAS